MKNRIAEQWRSYVSTAFSKAISESLLDENTQSTQRIEMRRAFYAGAAALYTEIMKGLTPGPDFQPADEHFLGELDLELTTFADAVKRGFA